MNEDKDVVGLESAVPNPKKTIGNLRGSAYDLNHAVADLIDNSIESDSTNIHVTVALDGSYISISDDGHGMDEKTHQESMKLASETRQYSSDDLGKFGTGMKAASLSLGKSLTVATKSVGSAEVTVRRLDEDHVIATNDWDVATQVLTEKALPSEVIEKLLDNRHGTCIILEKLDKAFGPVGDKPVTQRRILTHLEELEAHLGLVFHRFIDGSYRNKQVNIYLNDTLVRAWDPFCLKANVTNPTLAFDETKVSLGLGREIRLQGYCLPKKDEFRDESEHRAAGGPKKWNDSQGFYVYRNGRLIRWGGWLRTRSSDEHVKLARIRLDFDGSQDTLFSINVAKSNVELPQQLREKLAPYIKEVAAAADKRYRSGKKTPPRPQPPGRDGGPKPPARSYRANDLATIIASYLQDDPQKLDDLKRAVTNAEPDLAAQIRWELGSND